MARDFRLPDLGEGIREGEILKVLVAPGDVIAEDQPLFEIETDKAATEIPSPYAGRIADIHVREGETVEVGTVLVTFSDGEPDQPRAEGTRAADLAPIPPPESGGAGPAPATPATRRRARELGVDLNRVRGTGPLGRVTDADVEAFAESVTPPPPATAAKRARERTASAPLALAPMLVQGSELPPLPDFTQWGPVERLPLRSVRRRIAEHMTLAYALIPHVSHFDRADITELEEFRQRHQAESREHDAQLTLTTFVLKAAVTALKRHPRFNASLDYNSGELVLKRYYHLGVAVDTDRGLIVPVLRNVDRKNIWELAVELGQLVQRTRAGKADLEALRGGTFTVTNIGSLGGTGMVPIINYPEVAILGLARARQEPAVHAGAIVPRLMLPLSLTFDHRVADGADAARFVSDIVRALEDPDRLLPDS